MTMSVKLREFTDTVVLGSGHSLIAGYKPEVVPHSVILENFDKHVANMDLEKFGLFDNSSPNYTTYYPDVTAEDLNPSEDEFIEPTFRLLSEAVVHKFWNPIDFGAKQVLKKSMQKLIGQTVNIDHETALGNAIGSVKEVFWQNATKAGEIEIPAGINGVLKIDAKANPRIARGILMDPPSIHSNSVTVRFKWVKSHSDMADEEFWGKLATYDAEGQLIRRIVTEVVSYHETSLVAHGADPFAQIIGEDGKINNPGYSDSVYNLSAEQKAERKKQGVFVFDFKSDVTTLSEKSTIPPNPNNNTSENKNSMKELIALAALIGFTLDEGADITEDNFEEKFGDHLKALKVDADKLAAETKRADDAEANVTQLTSEKEDLESKVEELKSKEPIADKALAAVKARATELYQALLGDKADETMLNVIENADYVTSTSLLANFEKQAEGKFEAKCNACGSHDITRASAALNGEGVVNPEKPAEKQELQEGEEKDIEETQDALRAKHRKNRKLFPKS